MTSEQTVQRFSQRNTSFARSHWDPTCVAHGQTERENSPDRTGYTHRDAALQTGAWAVARSRMPPPDAPADSPYDASRKTAGNGTPDDPQLLTRHVKQAAVLYGAAMVGIAPINPLWIYASDGNEERVELPDGIDKAVVLAVEMDYDRISASPSMVAGAATGNGYSRMAFTSSCLARYLAELGWRAIPSGNDIGLSIPLAIDAGMGELGRNGILITPLYGPRVRLCKVFTDAPLIPDRPIEFGVKEFCDICMKCADTCPSRSISREEMTLRGSTPSNNPGSLKWYTNPDTCLAFWRKNGVSCSNCIRSCPFNKRSAWFHDLARLLIRRRSHLVDRLLVFLDDLCGYGSARSARRALEKFAAETASTAKKKADAVKTASA
jgi:epoxyqueuosine reductase